ncbi:MAG: hypothetical protein ABW122_12650 [Ilumatobacteraceae bacterium]
MSATRIRFVGPASLALGVATALADADGVELLSSEVPAPQGAGVVALDVTVDGSLREVAGAVDRIRDGLPPGARIDVSPD